ncbi:MAG: hypothetical protein P1V51_05665 [Deltaproteobacteria bacterium]|nr:hypothetical protein [Deltaproteobacteria bacterium]
MIRPLLALSLLLPALATAEPFAPTPTLPAGYGDQLYTAIVKQMKKDMPDASKVPAPLCPGCVAMQLGPGMEGALPAVQLLSPASKKEVVAFYSEKLKGWNKTEEHGFQWVFWKGGQSQLNSMMPTVPHVVVFDALAAGLDKKLFAKMKTQVVVYFPGEPGKAPPAPPEEEDEEE